MDAFWCITLIFIMLRFMWVRRPRPVVATPAPVIPIGMSEAELDALDEAEASNKIAKDKEARKQKDIADLKKQGYTDELITVILPTLHNDGQ